MTDRFWCEHAWVAGQTKPSVTIETANGRIAAVTADTVPTRGATELRGLAVPGMANVHSHAFHRALRGRTHRGRGSFWVWRDGMYDLAGRLDPDRYYELARGVYGEMAMAGITAVGEFHYVHHQPAGTPYDDPNAMGHALLAAATDAGVRLTLLDTLYLHGGLTADGYQTLRPEHLRFADGSFDEWQARVERMLDAAASGAHRVGVAVHSVRAVDPAAVARVAEFAAEHELPVHAHVSEQVAENEAALAHFGRTPTALLADAGLQGERYTAVHATHLTDDDRARYAAGGFVGFCPTTERDLGDGIGPASELVDAGAALCLGTDSHAEIDVLGEARALEHDDRLRRQQRGLIAVDDLLTIATVNGQRSVGWADAGEFAVGQRADIVALDLGSVRTAGAPPGAGTAVFAATAADVTDVVIDGRHVVRDGRHRALQVADELSATIRTLTP